MLGVHYRLKSRPSWQEISGASACGTGFVGAACHDAQALCRLLLAREDGKSIEELPARLNGFFALVRETDGFLFAAVDPLRSIPLFYGTRAGEVFLSDDADWVRKQTHATLRGEPISNEFLLTGYVTGGDTLFDEVKQLQAGEMLTARRHEDRLMLSTKPYYRFRHADYSNSTREDLQEHLDEVVLRTVNRLVAVAAGRTIVVPLSGGFDSRLIAVTLRRIGYEPVVAYTYGRAGNTEARVSREVAANLGIPWHFVEYSNDAWQRWFNSEQREAFFHFAHGLCSVPHLQDWPAVWQMKEQAVLPEDALFVPGHSADLLAGSRSGRMRQLYQSGSANIHQIVPAIVDYHYRLWDWSQQPEWVRRKLRERIAAAVGDPADFSDGASAFESWDVRERQAKFIVNSVRAYDFWGYPWWMPFWDREFLDFWSHVPLRHRLGAEMYVSYVQHVYAKVAGLAPTVARRSERSGVVDGVKRALRSSPLYATLRRFYLMRKRHREYEENPLALFGLVGRERFRDSYSGEESINSFLSLMLLEDSRKMRNAS